MTAFAALMLVLLLTPDSPSTDDYVLIRSGDGACIAHVTATRSDTTTLEFGPATAHAAGPGKFTHDGADLPVFRAKAVIGLKAHSRDRSGKIVKIVRTATLGIEKAYLDDGRVYFAPENLCFDETPAGLGAIDYPERSPADIASASASASGAASSLPAPK